MSRSTLCAVHALAALLVLPTFATGQAPANKWPITHFVVHPAEPMYTETGDEIFAEISGTDPVTAKVSSDLEDYLHKVALLYESMGFRPPVLEPIVERPDGVKAFRVYMWDYDNNKPRAFYTGQCKGKIARTVIRADRSEMTSNGALISEGYETVAHELFHAVQMAYPFFSDECLWGDWLWEGTAEAMGVDAVYKIIPAMEPPRSRAEKRWAGRRLWTDLHVEDDPKDPDREKDAYHTASFWRYLAEWEAARSKPNKKKPAATEGPLDYGYLDTFFQTKAPSSNSRVAELGWLDETLQTHFGQSLPRVYAHYASVMAEYVPARVTLTKMTPKKAGRTWRKLIFEECARIRLEPSKETDKTDPIVFARHSSRCIEVEVDGISGNLELTVQTEGRIDESFIDPPQDILGMLGQLRVSVMGKELSSSPEVAGFPSDEEPTQAVAWWRIPIQGGQSTILIVSNMDKSVRGTVPQTRIFEISVPLFESSLTSVADVDPTKTSIEERAQLGYEQLTTYSSRSVMTSRDDPSEDTRCRPENREFNLCGPQVKIAMMKTPDVTGDGGLMTGSGGLINRMEQMSLGSGAGDEDAHLAQYGDLMEGLFGEAGGVISIAVPLVEYGFSGSINNADMSVSLGGTEQAHAVTLHPSSRVRLFVPNGSVTIQEYTPTMLRGTFKGVVRHEDALRNMKGTDMSTVRSQKLEGRFVIPAPWRTDEAYGKNFDALLDDTGGDLVEIMQKMPPGLRQQMMNSRGAAQLCSRLTPEQLEQLGLSESCAGGGGEIVEEEPSCSCDCDVKEQELTQPECIPQCQGAWEACPSETSPEAGEMAEFVELMNKHGIPPHLQEQYKTAFEMSPPHIRKQMLDQLREN